MRHASLLVLLLLALLVRLAPAQPVSLDFDADWKPDLEDDQHAQERARKKAAPGLRVRSVQVEGRWAGHIVLPLAVGDVLTPEKISESMNALRVAITTNSNEGFGLRSKGEFGVLFIDVDFDTNAPPATAATTPSADRTVGVIFRPFYLRLSLVKVGDNVLPIPRSPLPTFYDNVPRPLLALRPVVAMSYDRAFGAALGGGLQSDLLHLNDRAAPGSVANADRHLDLNAQGSKSLEESFYRADVGMAYRVKPTGGTVREFGVRADYVGLDVPLGTAEHIRNAGVASMGVGLKLAPNARLWLDAGYRFADDRMLDDAPAPDSRTTANEQISRLLFEMIPPGIHGFARASLWEESGWQTGSGSSYQRLVGRVGYAKEIPLSQNQTLGLELLAGGGKAWGGVPAYAQFFGGNQPGYFLYDAASSASMLQMPAGPLLRSFGQAEAGFRTPGGVRGGDAFWHVNLNLSFPIPLRGWSRPLIPNELTDLEDRHGHPLSIKQVLNNQINTSGPNMLAAALRAENPALSAEEAKEQAREILQEIQPASDYIINHANLYAIKPLLMFDAGGLSGGSGSGAQTWFAAGGGLQLTIVTATFEVGYMRSLSGPTFGNRGNVFARLVFQNLF